jgi:Fe-S-cluster containining protein
MTKTNPGYGSPRRLSFPDDEKAQEWLSMLLDAYHIVDRGVAASISREEKRGRTVACGNWCATCCETHRDIPVYPLELVGISWYVTEKLTGPVREVVKAQLRRHEESGHCPFLVEASCAVHAMRPMACRQFIVFGSRCGQGEDPYYTRRADVLTPIQKYLDEALFTMLPFYGVLKAHERRKAIESRATNRLVRTLHSCNWRTLPDRMDEFDKKG